MMEEKGMEAEKVIIEQLVPAKEGFGFIIHHGQRLRIIDWEGQQVVDMVAFSLGNPDEKLSCSYSNFLNRTWKLTKGHFLYSNRSEKMLTIVEDTVGMHYSGGGFCTDEINYVRFGVHGAGNCFENLKEALKGYGVKGSDIQEGCCLNIFMNFEYHLDGSVEVKPPFSKAGDYIDFRAEMDLIVGISNCPQDRTPVNAFNPSSSKVIIYNPDVPHKL
jgi:uncharacterized protein YcgI (DUF1989 family)